MLQIQVKNYVNTTSNRKGFELWKHLLQKQH